MKWRRCKLGDALSLQRGYDLPETERQEGDIPVYGSFGITGWHNEARVKGPGLTIGRSGGSMGVVNYCPADYWPHNAVLFATDFKGNDPRFLSYYLKTIDFKGINSGAAQPSLNRNIAYQLDISIPEPGVQRRIADTLSAYDDLIENNCRRMALLAEAARLLYREWFVRLRFPGHEQTRVIDGVPEDWERKELGEVMALQRGYDLPEARRVAGLIPIVSSSGITGFHCEKRADAPGVVTGRYGTLGEVYFIDQDYWPLNTALFVSDFKGNQPRVIVYFLKHALQSIQSHKAAVPGLNRNVVHALRIVWPPRRLLNQFDEFLRPIFAQVSVLRAMNDRLRAARDLLLPRLMSGEVAA